MTTTSDPLELFLPEPTPREVKYTVISVDDHVVEPPDTFEGRLPAKFADVAPRIVETEAGHQVWSFDGQTFTQVGMNAVAGRRPDTVKLEPGDAAQPGSGYRSRFDHASEVASPGYYAVTLADPALLETLLAEHHIAATLLQTGMPAIAWLDRMPLQPVAA